jgi:hypothetical protein
MGKRGFIRLIDGEGLTFCKIVQSCSEGKRRCLEVGYQDPSHFAKIFKKKEGVYPSEYRKKLLEFELADPAPVFGEVGS